MKVKLYTHSACVGNNVGISRHLWANPDDAKAKAEGNAALIRGLGEDVPGEDILVMEMQAEDAELQKLGWVKRPEGNACAYPTRFCSDRKELGVCGAPPDIFARCSKNRRPA